MYNEREKKPYIGKSTLHEYIKDIMYSEYNMNFDDRKVTKIIDSIEYGLGELIKQGYPFRFMGFRFEPNYKPPCVYKNVSTGVIEYSKAHRDLKIIIPFEYQKNLKNITRFDTDDPPKRVGVSEEECNKFLEEQKK